MDLTQAIGVLLGCAVKHLPTSFQNMNVIVQLDSKWNSGLLHKALPKLGYSKTISVSSHFSWLSGSQRNCRLCYKLPVVFCCFFLPMLYMFIYTYELFFPPPSSLLKDFEVNTFSHLSSCICCWCCRLALHFVV